jgi:hypothetical protein
MLSTVFRLVIELVFGGLRKYLARESQASREHTLRINDMCSPFYA